MSSGKKKRRVLYFSLVLGFRDEVGPYSCCRAEGLSWELSKLVGGGGSLHNVSTLAAWPVGPSIFKSYHSNSTSAL